MEEYPKSSERLKEIHMQNLKAAKKIVAQNDVKSEELEEDLDVATILRSILRHYPKTADTNEPNLLPTKTLTYLENSLNSDSVTCVICIESIRHADAIWSCKHCYCLYHLKCIKHWASESTARLKSVQQLPQQGYYNHLGEYIPPKRLRPLYWCCPQCRNEYSTDQQPKYYECYCGKEVNPSQHTWMLPHSCGNTCGQVLKPICGHKCILLCHPGPCPPCIQYAQKSCLCQNSPKRTVRCIEQKWQCDRKCQKILECNEHRCNVVCHVLGECPPCSNRSIQSCECGAESKMRNCFELKWNCSKVCGKMFSCGIHACERICHEANTCGNCPLSLPRFCPCGKTKKIVPCIDIIETCGDTCQKLLKCGKHTCAQRCHRGGCNLCLVITKKKCRCGLREKDLPCARQFTCEMKCKQLRDCNKHPCNRKCCDGRCPPCDKVCGKLLACKKHKCQTICHEGPCYPCERQSQVNCRCGKTSKSVPCGRERSVKILCTEPCRIPSKCHHLVNHQCHKQECPPCNQICGLPNETTGCEHPCAAKCHGAVRSNTDEIVKLPHPKCEKKVLVHCIGGHELAEWPCWNSKPSSCKRPCNRLLRCGNHKCERICHNVPDIHDMKEQNGCASCEKGCQIEPPDGCKHACQRPCHLPPCGPCLVNIKMKCHCGLTSIIFKCSEFYDQQININEQAAHKERLLSCGVRCMKTYPCGHQCVSTCHSNKCPNPENCRKKVRISCACKRLKIDISCDKQRANGLQVLPCDKNCKMTNTQIELVQQLEAAKQKNLEEERNLQELALFEQKIGLSKRNKQRERKTTTPVKKREFPWQTFALFMTVAAAFVLAIVLAFLED